MKVSVGIDVSKATLDVAVLVPDRLVQTFQRENSAKGHKEIISRVLRLAKGMEVHWCMEVTASYHMAMALALAEAGMVVSLENPRRVKSYGAARGSVQKTDRADAKVIAHYCADMNPAPWNLPPAHMRELADLDRRLADLSGNIQREMNRLEAEGHCEVVTKGLYEAVDFYQNQVKKVEERIRQLISEHEDLKEKVELLCSIPAVAVRSSVCLLSVAYDISRFESAQSLAAYFGLNPKLRRSGSSVRGRTAISKEGNAHARSKLFLPALTAIRHNPVIKAFHDKLIAQRKHKKAVIVACERKLVMLCYGVLKSGKPFDPKHCS